MLQDQCYGENTPQLVVHTPSLEDSLSEKQQRLETQLADIKEVQSLLKGNPTLARFHNLLLRTRNL